MAPRAHKQDLSGFRNLTGLFAALALLGGLLFGYLPLRYSLAALVSVVVVFATLRQPLIGLALAVLMGPFKALLSASAIPSPFSDPGQLALALTLAVWLARAAYRRNIKLQTSNLISPLSLSLFAFTFLAALSLTQATDFRAGLLELFKWIEMALIALLVVEESQEGRAKWVIALALLSGVVQAGIGLWEFGLRGDGPETFLILERFYRAYGTFEQPNPFGGFMGLVWPVAAGTALGLFGKIEPQRHKVHPGLSGRTSRTGKEFSWFSWCSHLHCAARSAAQVSSLRGESVLLVLVALASFGALALSFSRGAWLGAGAAVAAMLPFWPRKRWVGAGLLVGAIGAGWLLAANGLLPSAITSRLQSVAEFTQVSDVRGVDINDANYALVERVALWQAALDMARDHPWLGVGLGNYEAAYPKYQLVNWKSALGHAHNIYLNMLAETGVVGLAAYLVLWGAVFAFTIRALRRQNGWRRGLALGLLGAFAHLAAHNLTDNLYVNNTHLLLGVFFGLLIWLEDSGSGLQRM